jgi:aminoglycoside 3-N-acetyltransferase
MSVEGRSIWTVFDAPDYDTEGFDALGAAFEAQRDVAVVSLGAAACRLFSMREAVDFASTWAL